jgi:hypothetical protein
MRKAASPGWAYPMGKGRPSLSGAEEVRAGAPDPHAARSTSQGVGRQGKKNISPPKKNNAGVKASFLLL